jgi:hypothetical protein
MWIASAMQRGLLLVNTETGESVSVAWSLVAGLLAQRPRKSKRRKAS